MMWVLWSFIAFVTATFIYATIDNNQIPEEWSWLRKSEQVADSGTATAQGNAQVVNIGSWVYTSAPVPAISKSAGVVMYDAAGNPLGAPTVSFVCFNNKPFVQLNTVAAVALKDSQSMVMVGDVSEIWSAGSAPNVLFALPDSQSLSRLMLEKPHTIRVGLKDAGPVQFEFDSTGVIKARRTLPPSCH